MQESSIFLQTTNLNFQLLIYIYNTKNILYRVKCQIYNIHINSNHVIQKSQYTLHSHT